MTHYLFASIPEEYVPKMSMGMQLTITLTPQEVGVTRRELSQNANGSLDAKLKDVQLKAYGQKNHDTVFLGEYRTAEIRGSEIHASYEIIKIYNARNKKR